jgi:hypothetical protein
MSLKKSGNNKFAGYQYFELGDFLPQTIDIFHDLGLCDAVSFSADLATLKVINSEKPDEVIEFTSPMGSAALKGCHEVQNIGAVETYQRRYLWVTAMDIVEHDALDATTAKEATSTAKSVTKDTFDKLPTDVQTALKDIAMDVIAMISKGDVTGAFEYIEEQQLDADSKTGLWSLFDSKQRSALKQISTTKKAA